MTALAWQARGNCVGLDPDMFFPDKGEWGERVAEAKAVCAGCAVRSECLGYALDHNQKFGVWGGLTVLERRAVRRQRRGAQAGSAA